MHVDRRERDTRYANASSLQRFQERDQVGDLVRVEAEFRHVRMAGDNSLGQRFLQRLDRIALMQDTKWRRRRQRALAGLVHRVAPGAVGARKGEAALNTGGLRGGNSEEQ